MGVSRITAMQIQSRDDVFANCSVFADESGKHRGYVMAGERILISTEPVFDSKNKAVEHMQNVINEIKEVDVNALHT